MEELEKKIGYSFKNKELLSTALSHSSYANEHRKDGIECNERLEFLGDSILGMVTAEYLFRNEPDMPEGKMTRLRAELVCERSLVEVASELELNRYLQLGKGEEHGGGRNRPSIMADAVEAILAAVYLDGGIEPARNMVSTFILSRIEQVTAMNSDYKTELQEYLQRDGAQDISYRTSGESGPDHNKVFTAEVCLNGEAIGSGDGNSKKEAEQAAAKDAMARLSK